MLNKGFAFLFFLAGFAAVHACRFPDNACAVTLNDGESVEGRVIEHLGEEGVNYFKDSGIVTYTFRSHYNPSIMINLGITVPRIVFTADSTVIQSSDFSFSACVRSELDWMVNAGVLSLDRLEREKIEAAFSSNAKGFIYWTKQDTLAYSGYVATEDGVFRPVDCSESPVMNLPPQQLAISTDITGKNLPRHTRPGSKFDAEQGLSFRFFDLRGRSHKAGNRQSAGTGVKIGYTHSGIIKGIVLIP